MKKYVYLLACVIMLITILSVQHVYAALSTEEEIEAEIARQTFGRLPGAKIVAHNPTISDRDTFWIEIEFNVFDPQIVPPVLRNISQPGNAKIPDCYIQDEEGAVEWTDECDATAPPAFPITEYYDADGNSIPAALICDGCTDVTVGNEGDEILYDPDGAGGPLPPQPIFITPREYARYPSDGSRMPAIDTSGGTPPTGAPYTPVDANGNPIMDPTTGAPLQVYPNTVSPVPGVGASVPTARYVDTPYTPKDSFGNNIIDPVTGTDLILQPCNRNIGTPTDPEYPPGYLVDYDGQYNPVPPINNGVEMRYPTSVGQPIFDEECNNAKRCDVDPTTGATIYSSPGVLAQVDQMSGDIKHIIDPLDPTKCIRVRPEQNNPVTAILGPESDVSTAVPLFLQRFFNDYNNAQRVAIMSNADPTPPPPPAANGPSVTIRFTGEEYVAFPPAPYQNTLISFHSEYEGDFLCIYAQSFKQPGIVWRVEEEVPQSLEEVFDLIAIEDGSGNPVGEELAPKIVYSNKHCKQVAPPLTVFSPLDYNINIDPTTGVVTPETTYVDMISPICTEYNTATSSWRWPFTSVVVECIEDTLQRIFIDDPADGSGLSFYQRTQIKFKEIIRLLLVLYVIIFGIRMTVAKQVPDRAEWMWFGLRVAFILYFTWGTGVTDYFSDLTRTSKDISATVMDAGLNGSTGGYDYCAFPAGGYPTGKEHIRLWDTIDCRMAKYLGIGDNTVIRRDGSTRSTNAPQVIWVGVTSIISSWLGFPLFFISLIITIFLILITVRAVHIYILAYIGLIMLFFISPIVIPAALFQYTRSIFWRWFQQVIAYLIQPIILFGFLSFAFVTVDTVYFQDNKSFVPIPPDITPNYRIADSLGASPGGADSVDECDDRTAIGCIYQTIDMTHEDIGFLEPLTDIGVYKVSIGGDDLILLVGLLKLLLICFIIKTLLTTVEQLAAKLVGDAMQGGSSINSMAAPAVGPAGLAGASSGVVGVGMKGVTKVSEFAGRSVEKRMAVGKGGETMLEKDIRLRESGKRGGRTRGNSMLEKNMEEREAMKAGKGEKPIDLRGDSSRTEPSMVDEIIGRDRQQQKREAETKAAQPMERPATGEELGLNFRMKDHKAKAVPIKDHRVEKDWTSTAEDHKAEAFKTEEHEIEKRHTYKANRMINGKTDEERDEIKSEKDFRKGRVKVEDHFSSDKGKGKSKGKSDIKAKAPKKADSKPTNKGKDKK